MVLLNESMASQMKDNVATDKKGGHWRPPLIWIELGRRKS
jgi:hypothetical protein